MYNFISLKNEFMLILEGLPFSEQKKAKDLVLFGNLEEHHFEDCVQNGTMSEEERKTESRILHDKVQGEIHKIIFPKK